MSIPTRLVEPFDAHLKARLRQLAELNLRRTLQARDAIDFPLNDFGGNDYLGLSRHAALRDAAIRATQEAGTGAGASRLISGTRRETLALETELAAWKQVPAALVFGSGFAAALGTIPALVGRGDLIFLDRLAHACLVDGARLSGATLRVFPHNNVGRLDALLARAALHSGRKLIVTESLFSMDGDAAPLAELVSLKEKHGAWLLVDEAHATGLYGPTGAGLIAAAELGGKVEITLGTLSKAVGSVGGYLAGSRALIDWLINRARSFIYSTALPPGTIAASRAAVALLQTAQGAELRRQLHARIAQWQALLAAEQARLGATTASAIQPIHCGTAARALTWAGDLRRNGYFVPAIRPPTVPRGTARLRVTLSAIHEPAAVVRLAELLIKALEGDAARELF